MSATPPLRHPDVVARLTLEQKASLTSGDNFWHTVAVPDAGIPAIMLTDGPHGVRKQGGKADHLGLNASLPATCFPTAAALAQTWDPELIEQVGQKLGAEARGTGVSVLLGPGLNIVRNPLGGRSFEYFSEDPRLSGELAAAMVRGIQSTGVAACPKHFAVNSQEHLRMSVDEVVDERSLREIYLEGFRRVVEGSSPRTLMTSYNRVNGTYANENTHLLADILQDEWGFDGVVVTDWGGNHDRVAGLRAGNQLEMPSTGGVTDAQIVAAVRSGELDESVLDRAVDDLVELALTTSAAVDGATPVDLEAQHAAAVDAARRSLVLLKNAPPSRPGAGPLLPLQRGTRVAVVGDFAASPRYQGAGSSLVNPTRVDDALSALQASDVDVIGYAQGFDRFGRADRKAAAEAVALARRAQTVLLFLGLDETSEAEGVDREHLRLPANQLELVAELARWNDRIVVVLAGGAPVEMPFEPNVAAILHTALAGQGGGTAVADVLTGAAEPSGRLAVTFPRTLQDVPSARSASPAGVFPGAERTAEHRDGIFVGYRYYTTRGVETLYPFGHGLSYTTFEHTSASVEALPDGAARVRVTVRNTGDRPGREVVQVYVGHESLAPAPRVELGGFASVELAAGESREVTVDLDGRAFEHYSVASGGWVCPGGTFHIEVGSSVEDVRATLTLTLDGDAAYVPSSAADLEALGAYASGDVQRVADAEFTALLGRELAPSAWDPQAPLTIDDTVAQLRFTNLLGRSLLGLLHVARRVLLVLRRPHAANNVMFLVNMPLSKVEGYTAGRVSRRAVERFVRWVNR